MKRHARKFATLGSALSMALALSACHGEKAASPTDPDLSVLDSGAPMDWPMNASGPFADGYRFAEAPVPLQAAAPMTASYAAPASRSYRRAPVYDYAADRPVYYDDAPADDSYAWLAMASMLGDVFADSPPDYYFDYDGVEPWVWETGDGYARYAEPLDDGYRYYYYQPHAVTPFLVRDPYYSYGYRGDRLAVIYDRDGRVLDGRRAWIQRRAAQTYYQRANRLYEARRDHRRYGVAAPRWASERPVFAREQQLWDNARGHRAAWQGWDRRHDRAVQSRWQDERVARRFAARRFDDWRKADYRGPAPRLAVEARRNARVQSALAQQRERAREVAAVRTARIRDVDRRQANLGQNAAWREQRQTHQFRQIQQAQSSAATVTGRQAQAREQQVQRRVVAARETAQRNQMRQRGVEAQRRQAAMHGQRTAQQAEQRRQQSQARRQQAVQVRQQRARQQASAQQQRQQVERRMQVRRQQSQARQQSVQRREQQQAMRRQSWVERPQQQARQQQRAERTQAMVSRAAASRHQPVQ